MKEPAAAVHSADGGVSARGDLDRGAAPPVTATPPVTASTTCTAPTATATINAATVAAAVAVAQDYAVGALLTVGLADAVARCCLISAHLAGSEQHVHHHCTASASAVIGAPSAHHAVIEACTGIASPSPSSTAHAQAAACSVLPS